VGTAKNITLSEKKIWKKNKIRNNNVSGYLKSPKRQRKKLTVIQELLALSFMAMFNKLSLSTTKFSEVLWISILPTKS